MTPPNGGSELFPPLKLANGELAWVFFGLEEPKLANGVVLVVFFRFSIEEASKATQVTLAKARKTLSMLERAAAPESPLRYNLNNTLEELSAAARSIRVLAEYLERHPEALVRGKGGSER